MHPPRQTSSFGLKLQTETVKALFSAYLWNRPQLFQILLLPRSSCEMTNRNEVTMYQELNVPLHWREKSPTEAILVDSYLWETAQRKYWTVQPQRPKGRFIGDQGREKSKMVGKQADFIWHQQSRDLSWHRRLDWPGTRCPCLTWLAFGGRVRGKIPGKQKPPEESCFSSEHKPSGLLKILSFTQPKSPCLGQCHLRCHFGGRRVLDLPIPWML